MKINTMIISFSRTVSFLLLANPPGSHLEAVQDRKFGRPNLTIRAIFLSNSRLITCPQYFGPSPALDRSRFVGAVAAQTPATLPSA